MNMQDQDKVIAMYDTRGIQNFIFRTNKIKDAIGASLMVEDIIRKALEAAVRKGPVQTDKASETEGTGGEVLTIRSGEHPEGNVILDWDYVEEENDPDGKTLRFLSESSIRIQILFIGGGNAYVAYRGRGLCVEINKRMSKYILEHTYSLQLAAAIVPMKEEFSKDYNQLHIKMGKVKECMPDSRPLGAFPNVRIELNTGFPVSSASNRYTGISTETYLKKEYKDQWVKQFDKEARRIEDDEKILDNLVLKKGIDSMIAVVHIDGNNMGLRIRNQIEGIENYSEAISCLRIISHNIDTSYKDTFRDMKNYIEEQAKQTERFQNKEKQIFIRKIITAGDDITFICNAALAISCVEYFAKEISKKEMLRENERRGNGTEDMRFSICAGIAFTNSHFPFSLAYQVAEGCCDSAKKRAKDENYLLIQNGSSWVGNWLDFQICKNIQTVDLEETRKREYALFDGKSLLLRPYYIDVRDQSNGEREDQNSGNRKKYDLEWFKQRYRYFSQKMDEEQKTVRSICKKLRNTYPEGEEAMKTYIHFLASRGKHMPCTGDGTEEEQPFDKDGKANWYDVLESMDYYEDVFHVEGEAECGVKCD